MLGSVFPEVNPTPELPGFLVLAHYIGILSPNLVVISHLAVHTVEIQKLLLRAFQLPSGTSKLHK